MAEIKKNQMANIIFPIIDGTDFATVESGITASNFDSKVTKKFFGVTHGNSTAFTSGTISKAATLVRSGLIQQTLKAAETNYDYIVYSFAPANTSLAQQILVFQPVDYDDSDIMSRLSDVGSDLRSYLVGMSGMISDVDSQLLLNASMVSDVQSALDSQYAVLLSNISDIESQLDLVATSDYLSAVHSDLASAIGGVTASVSTSDMSDIASQVWAHAVGTRVDSRILVVQSMVSDVDSQLLLNASMISDVDSQLTVTDTAMDSQYSDLASKIGNVSVTLTASDISDIASAVTAAGVNLTASDMSDIASRVWATTEGTRVDSRILVVQSMVSDVDSQLLLTASLVSDIDSALTLHDANISGMISDVDSQLLLNASMISDIDSQLNLNASVISDAHSAAILAASHASDAHSMAQNIDSQLLLNASMISDVDSQLLLNASMISDIDSQLTVTHSLLSDVESQLDLGVSASDMSDIASRVWATATSEPTGVLTANAAAGDKLAWVYTLSRNKLITDADSAAIFLRNDADNSNIASAAESDDGSQFIRGEWV